ncbi:Uncharacterized protein TPAR_00570 [Tolypocladium paradoxum]|uniref:Uncharacterized protein n=1 Tax=Tolypocladium paradoxum TaxID=94208 RepID=A0A2S4L9V3_9HYPO|nr:Uncharacterized protein TPAR_00570 [Tolypocladium paradoxum]
MMMQGCSVRTALCHHIRPFSSSNSTAIKLLPADAAVRLYRNSPLCVDIRAPVYENLDNWAVLETWSGRLLASRKLKNTRPGGAWGRAAMFRASRPLLRLTLRASLASSTARASPRISSSPLQLKQPLRPLGLPVSRFASSSSGPAPPKQPIDREHEKKVAQETIKPRPGHVSSGSSVRHVMEGSPSPGRDEANLGGGLKHDIGIIKDTFRLSQVPRESHILGLAGTVPYLATSLSTVFLAWDLTKNVPTGNSFYDAILVNHETAQHLLGVIEPLQLGYGAVIISFLGAIHWAWRTLPLSMQSPSADNASAGIRIRRKEAFAGTHPLPLRHGRRGLRRRLAHPAHAHRVRPHHTVHGLCRAVLCRCARRHSRLGPVLVRHLPPAAHRHGRRRHRRVAGRARHHRRARQAQLPGLEGQHVPAGACGHQDRLGEAGGGGEGED